MTRQFCGNHPDEFESILGTHPAGWVLYLTKQDDFTAHLKLVAQEAQPNKGNYWLQYSKKLGRLSRSRDAGMLAEHRPELLEWVAETYQPALKSTGELSYGHVPANFEQHPHQELQDANDKTWLVVRLSSDFPWENLKVVYVEVEGRPGRANYNLGYNIREERWAKRADGLPADPALGRPFLERVHGLLRHWRDQEMFS